LVAEVDSEATASVPGEEDVPDGVPAEEQATRQTVTAIETNVRVLNPNNRFTRGW
jgi:hypothetical protein